MSSINVYIANIKVLIATTTNTSLAVRCFRRPCHSCSIALSSTSTIRRPLSPASHVCQLIEEARPLLLVARVERRATLELELAALATVATKEVEQEKEYKGKEDKEDDT